MSIRMIPAKVNVLERCVTDCEKAVIVHALLKTNGDPLQAAELLGIKARLLAEKIKKYKIDCAQFE
jgi:DNA-binding NtrC family response regulator